MGESGYNRNRAVRYAHKWAYDRNPKYAKFDRDGGDCTNYASQVLLAGAGKMNMRDWYYIDVNHRAPAWTGVVQLYRFLINNTGHGPYAEEVDAASAEPGDLVQLRFDAQDRFRHTPVIVQVGEPGDLDQILVAAHNFNADNRPLSSYHITEMRFLHILGVRK
ncbi:amidase domain-containing protein [Eubacteriales bacterium OttesenSCG-928-N13]|nr:amidase domain-containing protein [Eubacteriales bacterium OttesenSCG-928-N13]